jgi:TetR/AcrR family transcriptional repressor of mexJK operon
LSVTPPRLAADVFLAKFLGDGHIRGLLRLTPPEPRQDRALLREVKRVLMAAFRVGV